MSQAVLITGASSGFGAMSARALGDAGNIVYASMRDTGGRNAAAVATVNAHATQHGVDLRSIQLDGQSQESAVAAVQQIVAEQGRLVSMSARLAKTSMTTELPLVWSARR